MKVIDDVKTLKGDTHKEKADDLKNQPVVIVSKSHCSFCLKTKQIFDKLKVSYTVLEVDKTPNAYGVHEALKDESGHHTVPSVYIKGEHVGGYQQVAELIENKKIDDMVGDLKVDGASGKPNPDHHRAIEPLFWFPNIVNGWTVRFTGMQASMLSLAGIVFRESPWSKCIPMFLAVDYGTRLLGLGSVSILNNVAQVASKSMPKNLRPGASKQFATLCGTCFSLGASTFFLQKNPTYGAAVLGVLSVASGMEGFFDFCVGCVFFEMGVSIKEYFSGPPKTKMV
jgi:glutaredoxin 3